MLWIESSRRFFTSLASDLLRHYRELHKLGVHFVTPLDAKAACSEDTTCSEAVERTATLLSEIAWGRTLKCHAQTAWRPPKNREEKLKYWLNRCSVYVFALRLEFYLGRSNRSSTSQIPKEFDQVQKACHIPEDFPIAEELPYLQAMFKQQYEQGIDDLNANVELEWAGPKTPLEQVSTPITGSSTELCSFCRGIKAPELLITPCKHAYCKECLEAWIYATQRNSHTCPYCDTEIFPKPDYRAKEPDVV